MKKTIGAVISVLACAVAMLALQVNLGYAQNHDHFKTYNVTPFPLVAPIPVTLEDQFGPVEGQVDGITMFSNPVVKELPGGEVSPIADPNNHLTWYPFMGLAGPHTILVSNQFGGDQKMTVENFNFILLPAWKMLINGQPTPHDHPSILDHYVCYDVTSGPPVGLANVTLTDQFHQEIVEVGDPRVFCNPADKIIPDDGLPMYDPDNHLACYDIIPHVGAPPLEVWANDQFGDSMFMVLQNELLCVPSTKILCVPEICDGIDNDCDGVIPADEIDDDGDGYVECTPWAGSVPGIIGGGDCNDGNANIYPGNSNANCDCADPIRQGTPENQAAGNCADGADNDCDGLIDTDPECTGGTCTGSAEASTYEASPVYGSSDLSKHLAYLILPIGVLIAFRIWRRKR